MQTAIYDGAVFDENSNQRAQQEQDDKRLVVIFYLRPVQNNVASKEAGRPIFDEIEYIKILTPGSKDTFETMVSDEYRERFAQQYAKFQANKEQTVSGTPLDQVPWLTVGQIAEFKAVNVHSVEALVGMSDVLSAKFMGHFQIKARAKMFLEAAAGEAPALKLQAELEQRDEKIKQQEELINSLANRLDKLETKKV
jgi:hypothetical protein